VGRGMSARSGTNEEVRKPSADAEGMSYVILKAWRVREAPHHLHLARRDSQRGLGDVRLGRARVWQLATRINISILHAGINKRGPPRLREASEAEVPFASPQLRWPSQEERVPTGSRELFHFISPATGCCKALGVSTGGGVELFPEAEQSATHLGRGESLREPSWWPFSWEPCWAMYRCECWIGVVTPIGRQRTKKETAEPRKDHSVIRH
jgi:hypothetical protein